MAIQQNWPPLGRQTSPDQISMRERLTKSGFLTYLACPREFWLRCHHPDLPESIHPLESSYLRRQGYAVEKLALTLDRFQPSHAQKVETQREFQTREYQARTDIVVTDLVTGVLHLFEIKAASVVRDVHVEDIAFQAMVAEQSGARIGSCTVLTMNTEYVRSGSLVADELFVATDVTYAVAQLRKATEISAQSALNYLLETPVASLADYCAKDKLNCPFLQAHFPDLPDYTIFDIPFLKDETRRALLANGIVDIRDLPPNFPLTPRQQIQVDVARTGRPHIDKRAIRAQLESLEYPIHFLDYETFSFAIPQFVGTRPFQQTCFQYSLHSIDYPGGDIRHRAFLSRGDDDPPRSIVEHLHSDLEGGIGTVIVWYENFEKTRNEEMAVMFPEFEPFFSEVNRRTYDLMKIFSDGLVVHPDFRGRSSIKKVLPVLAPDLDYTRLEIGDGLTATIKWAEAAFASGRSSAVKFPFLNDSEREKIFANLLEYCKLDTLAMVTIFNSLINLVNDDDPMTGFLAFGVIA